jgi:periplasmic protein TonB
MIRSFLFLLLVGIAFAGGALGTVYVVQGCEIAGSSWNDVATRLCADRAVPLADAGPTGEDARDRPAGVRSRAARNTGGDPRDPAGDVIPDTPVSVHVVAAPYRPPSPILLRQTVTAPAAAGAETPSPPGSDEPARTAAATAPHAAAWSVVPTSVPRPRDDDEVRRLLASHYPRHLASSGTGGMVVLALMISPQGRVRDPEVVSGSGVDALDVAAIEVARRVRFTPAVQNGRSVEAQILFPLVFSPS